MAEPIQELSGHGSLAGAPVRDELLGASDATIDDATAHGDPMVLRGLIYQLTGDPEIAATTPVVRRGGGLFGGLTLGEEDAALVRRKAAEFLKSYRDRGAGDLDIGPAERLLTSMTLTIGSEPEPDAVGPVARGAGPRSLGPRPGMVAGADAATRGLLRHRHRRRHGGSQRGHPAQAGGDSVLGRREERRCRRHLVRESLPGRTRGHPEPALHPCLRRRLQLRVSVLSLDGEPEVLQLGGRHVRRAR